MMKEKTFSGLKINLIAFAGAFVCMAIVVAPYLILNFNQRESRTIDILPLLLSVLLGIVIHELIHGLCFLIYAPSRFGSIKYGIKWKHLTPYCYYTDALYCWQYRIVAFMPFVVLGILPVLLGFIIKNYTILTFGCIMMVASTGDLIVIWALRCIKRGALIQDLPNKIGFLYEEDKKDLP